MGFNVPKLLDLEAQIKAEQAKVKAAYKIEIHFGKARKLHGLNPVLLTIWESGKRLHGGGDQKLYWCGWDNCRRPIEDSNFTIDTLTCQHCDRTCFLDSHVKMLYERGRRSLPGKSHEQCQALPVVAGELLASLPLRKIASMLARVFRDLGSNADVYLKYHPSDIRFDPLHQDGKAPDILDKARRTRVPGVYKLESIFKDTVDGASIENRFYGFLSA